MLHATIILTLFLPVSLCSTHRSSRDSVQRFPLYLNIPSIRPIIFSPSLDILSLSHPAMTGYCPIYVISQIHSLMYISPIEDYTATQQISFILFCRSSFFVFLFSYFFFLFFFNLVCHFCSRLRTYLYLSFFSTTPHGGVIVPLGCI